jgi:hypothetical protein
MVIGDVANLAPALAWFNPVVTSSK